MESIGDDVNVYRKGNDNLSYVFEDGDMARLSVKGDIHVAVIKGKFYITSIGADLKIISWKNYYEQTK